MTKGPRAGFAFDCDLCGRRIGAKRTHLLAESNFVCCTRCALHDATRAHELAHPTCRQSWHDMFDHPDNIHTTRAAARRIQGARGRPPESSKHDDHSSKLSDTNEQVQ
jgi:ribosome-binding protein aMBF1 (putative translation factor)